MIRYPKHMKQKTIPPKGFDISLFDAIVRLDLNESDLQELGRMTATHKSGLAHATFGHNVWYREAQLRRLFNKDGEIKD